MFHETSKTCWKLQLWLHVVGFNLFMATRNNVNAAKPILYGYILYVQFYHVYKSRW